MDKFNNLLILTRIHNPIGIFLLLWPTLSALFMASGGFPNIRVLTIFIFGTILMRTAGCVVNDLIDRNLDCFVERTKNRPIASNIVSPKEASILLLVLIIFCFILVIQLNFMTICIAFIALIFSLTYPLTKRFFAVPQLYLGITFGFGILMAFSAVQNKIPTEALILFISNIFWAFAYDSHYAVGDMADDKKINIRSSPLTFNKKIISIVTLSYFLMFLSLFIIGTLENFSYIYYVLLSLAFVIAMYGCFESRHMDAKKNFKAFLRSNYIGMIIFFGFVSQLHN